MNLKELIDKAHTIVPKISCDELSKNLNDYLILDVREGTEVAETGSIPGAINIPRGLLEMKISPIDNDQNLNADTEILVYCGGGSRASLAGKILKDLGFKCVYNLDGGYRGWKEFSD